MWKYLKLFDNCWIIDIKAEWGETRGIWTIGGTIYPLEKLPHEACYANTHTGTHRLL